MGRLLFSVGSTGLVFEYLENRVVGLFSAKNPAEVRLIIPNTFKSASVSCEKTNLSIHSRAEFAKINQSRLKYLSMDYLTLSPLSVARIR